MSFATNADSISEVMSRLESGMALAKCRKCGCMANALEAAEKYARAADAAEMLNTVGEHSRRTERISYECLGCKRCWAAEAMNLLYEAGGEAENASCKSTSVPQRQGWPVAAGEYVLGSSDASVAVCTLSDSRLPAQVVDGSRAVVAIAGRCETENIGIEKIVLNIVSNPNIRWLILCGLDPEGHRPGDAILKLKESGMDAEMRISEAVGRRPVLRNVTLKDVARFRRQVEVVERMGLSDPEEIRTIASELATRRLSPLPEWTGISAVVPRIAARAPEHLKLDKAGFFVVIPDVEKRVIACEHYSYDGTLTAVLEGASADVIEATAVERGLVSQLDHAAYLGRELARAEIALKLGVEYVQDKALGSLPIEHREMETRSDENENRDCDCGSCR